MDTTNRNRFYCSFVNYTSLIILQIHILPMGKRYNVPQTIIFIKLKRNICIFVLNIPNRLTVNMQDISYFLTSKIKNHISVITKYFITFDVPDLFERQLF